MSIHYHMEAPVCKVAGRQTEQIPSDAQLLKLGHQLSVPYTVEGTINVKAMTREGLPDYSASCQDLERSSGRCEVK